MVKDCAHVLMKKRVYKICMNIENLNTQIPFLVVKYIFFNRRLTITSGIPN